MTEVLGKRLDAFRQAMVDRIGPAKAEAVMRAEAELRQAGAGSGAPRIGDLAPDFTLPERCGDKVTLSDALARGPVVLVFYRGGWCPFCTLTLRAWQDVLPELHRLGAEVLAISPERMRRCAETAERDMLDFPLLSDHDSQIAERYGLAHELPECLRPFYLKLGHDLPQVNGTGNWRLPLTATFLIGQDRRVILSHVEIPTYRRMEPTEAIAALRALRKERAQVTETAEA